MTVFTVGHGNRIIDELVAVVRPDVDTILDVRRYPGSQRNPQFNREALAETLPERGVGYEWRGDDLGGRRSVVADSRHLAWRVPAFQGYADYLDTDAARAAVLSLVNRDRVAVMCAETLWWRCHRRLLADALVVHGVEVVHLLDVNERQPHVLHPQLRVGDDGWPIYDVGVDRPLS